MKASELIEKLSKFDPDVDILISINDDFRKPYTVDLCWYDDYNLLGLVGEEDPDYDYSDSKQNVIISS